MSFALLKGATSKVKLGDEGQVKTKRDTRSMASQKVTSDAVLERLGWEAGRADGKSSTPLGRNSMES